MQTNLAEFTNKIDEQSELENIIRSCVHCGFCNATCPTYLLTGNELNGPRGRIYLIKEMLEGGNVSQHTQHYLDQCLGCRACETTCPSGVEYSRLMDLAAVVVEDKVSRPYFDRIIRQLILIVFPYRQRFKRLMQLATLFKPCLPKSFANLIPKNTVLKKQALPLHKRTVLCLSGCVQPALAPKIDLAAERLLNKFEISLVQIKEPMCCGALSYHLSEHDKAKLSAKKNIDSCWPLIEQGVEAITMTASGCGLALKEYVTLLQYDSEYAEKAKQFSVLVKDISEILILEDLSGFSADNKRVAFQSPCSLQHGQGLSGVVQLVLQRAGLQLVATKNSHLCCGSAGVYSILQADMAEQLRDQKLADLSVEDADCIVTANIGCLSHLQAKSEKPIVHWLELLESVGRI